MRLGKKDYDRNISLICPTCAGSDLDDPSDTDAVDRLISCKSCKQEFTYEVLRNANQEKIEAAISELKGEIVGDLQEDFNKMMKNAFKGSKSITFK